MRRQGVAAVVVAVAAALGSPAFAADSDRAAVARLADASSGRVEVYKRPAARSPYFARFDVPVSSFSRAASAAGRAADFWMSFGAVFGVRDAPAELALESVRTDRHGVTHV
ncbi:MAG: hypothetical protein M3310_05905, partial [Actinomycetota bacterium]|nr:hypothetical protein [Actinomycetota bacterium]